MIDIYPGFHITFSDRIFSTRVEAIASGLSPVIISQTTSLLGGFMTSGQEITEAGASIPRSDRDQVGTSALAAFRIPMNDGYRGSPKSFTRLTTAGKFAETDWRPSSMDLSTLIEFPSTLTTAARVKAGHPKTLAVCDAVTPESLSIAWRPKKARSTSPTFWMAVARTLAMD